MHTTNIYMRQPGKPNSPFRLTLVKVLSIISDDEFLGQLMNQDVTFQFKRDQQGVFVPFAV